MKVFDHVFEQMSHSLAEADISHISKHFDTLSLNS